MEYNTAKSQINELPPEQITNFVTVLFWRKPDLTINQQKIELVKLMVEYDLTISELKDEANNLNQFTENWEN